MTRKNKQKNPPRENKRVVQEVKRMLADLVRAGMVLKKRDARGQTVYSLTGQGITGAVPDALQALPGILCEEVQVLIHDILESATLLANIGGQRFPTPLWEKAARQEVFVPRDQMVCQVTPKGEAQFPRIYRECPGLSARQPNLVPAPPFRWPGGTRQFWANRFLPPIGKG